MNSAMPATALVPIEHAFPGEPGIAAWLIATLYLTAAVAQPVLGDIADRVGARPTLLGGMACLAIGAAAGGMARDPWTLIAARAFIGLGTAAGYPCAVVMIRRRAEQFAIEPPARLLGLLATASSVSVAIGPPLGGVLTGAFGWRWVFLVNLPLALVTSVMTLAFSPAGPRGAYDVGTRFDIPGVLLFALAMTTLMLFLMSLADGVKGWTLAVAAGSLAMLVFVERRAVRPFIDVRLLATNRPLTRTYAHHVLLNFTLYCLFYSIPQWWQAWLHMSVERSGLVLLPVAISSGVASLAPTRGRAGRAVAAIDIVSLMGTSAGLVLLGPETSLSGLMTLTFMFGIGNGVLNMANQQRMLDHAPPGQIGAAAGLLRTAQYSGAILCAPLTAYLLASHLGSQPMRMLAFILLPLTAVLLLLSRAIPPAQSH